jgi:predicted metal-dependent phosphoesterase TrpH
VTHLALTDHDTVAGLSRAASSAAEKGLSLISGTELSCVWRSQNIHIVGLDFDPENVVFQVALERQNANRWARARAITDKLSKIPVDDLLEKATEECLRFDIFKEGDTVVVISGLSSTGANTIKVHQI